ncbi:MAG TPA: hypothetical protein VEH48_00885 [Candidatus Nitrosopolaris sp.]|nr:hypothetical protein [Candidatus Nitrosopolaris sp.]
MFGINDNRDTSYGTDTGQQSDSATAGQTYSLPPSHDDPVAMPTVTHQPAPASTPFPAAEPPAAAPDSSSDGGELLQIKQQALHSLTPLIDKLEQTPEEKFKTTMMLLQASDNPTLVKDAYAAANQITDEKTRAQALLDVVNEINYFTHPGGA